MEVVLDDVVPYHIVMRLNAVHVERRMSAMLEDIVLDEIVMRVLRYRNQVLRVGLFPCRCAYNMVAPENVVLGFKVPFPEIDRKAEPAAAAPGGYGAAHVYVLYNVVRPAADASVLAHERIGNRPDPSLPGIVSGRGPVDMNIVPPPQRDGATRRSTTSKLLEFDKAIAKGLIRNPPIYARSTSGGSDLVEVLTCME